MRTVTHHVPGLILTDHEFTVPLDYAHPAREQIIVFAREVVAPDKQDADLPWLVFFQGGPGFGGPRPDAASGWLKRALKEFRVLLLDDRGTGRSTPVTHQTLAWRGSPQAQADYVAHFRADNIVADAEFIRVELLGPEGKWSVLGQSFGGFCVVHYLSAAPGSLRHGEHLAKYGFLLHRDIAIFISSGAAQKCDIHMHWLIKQPLPTGNFDQLNQVFPG